MFRPPTNVCDYTAIRPVIKTGDIVFFNGRGFVSWLIRFFTGLPTHGAIVMRTESDRIVLMESTMLVEGKRGVFQSLLSERAAAFEGEVWIARLSPDARRQLDTAKVEAWLLAQQGKYYDIIGAVYEGLEQLLPFLPESDYSRAFFCTRLCMAALRNGGLNVDREYSPTPHQLANLPLFSYFWQIKGAFKPL